MLLLYFGAVNRTLQELCTLTSYLDLLRIGKYRQQAGKQAVSLIKI